MAYVAVKGGEKAITNAHKLLAEKRRGDTEIPAISVDQVEQQLVLAVDRVMAEGSCYDRELAALAIKQSCGDLTEAVFMLRAYRTTLPRFGLSEAIETPDMAVQRRISAAFKDIPGGQVLGPTFDYTHRLLDFALLADGEGEPIETEIAEEGVPEKLTNIEAVFATEGLLESEAEDDGEEPFDLTREPMHFPADHDQRLQALARGDEGFLLGLAYSSQRGWGNTHPLCGEIRMGEVTVEFVPEELGFAIEIGQLEVTECQMLGGSTSSATRPPQYSRGYGLTFGHNERKAMSMAIVDRALRDRPAEGKPEFAAQDEEFVLYHSDNVEASGFVQHLKLPHYVDFQASLQLIRELRAEWFEHQEKSEKTSVVEERQVEVTP